MTTLLIIFAISAILIAYGGYDATRGKDNRETIKISYSFYKPVFRYPIPINRTPIIFENEQRKFELEQSRLDRSYQLELQEAEQKFREEIKSNGGFVPISCKKKDLRFITQDDIFRAKLLIDK